MRVFEFKVRDRSSMNKERLSPREVSAGTLLGPSRGRGRDILDSGINLVEEYDLIKKKQSNLSSRNRKIISDFFKVKRVDQ